MAGEKKIDKSEPVAAVLKSDPSPKVAGQDVASGKGGTPTALSSSISSSGDAISSMKGFQTDNGSLLYYLPGYDPYATGSFMGMDGQQPYYSSPGYLQQPVSYGSEAMPWDSAYVGDVANGTTGFPGKPKSAFGSNASMKSNSYNSVKSGAALASKFSTLPLDSRSRKSAASSNISKSIIEFQPLFSSHGLVPSLSSV